MRQQIKLKLYGASICKDVNIPDKFCSKLGYKVTKLCTDKNGYITYPDFKENNLPVYILGDSFIECSYVPEEKRLTDIVNKYFSNECHDKICIYNGGMSGSQLLNLYNLFINVICPHNPAIVCLFPGSVSATSNFLKDTYWNKSKDLSNLTDMYSPKENIKDGDNYHNFSRILKMFLYASELFGINFIIGITAYDHGINQDIKNERLLEMHDLLCKFACGHGLAHIDLNNLKKDNHGLFYDPIHLNENGSKFYGMYIANYLQNYLNI